MLRTGAPTAPLLDSARAEDGVLRAQAVTQLVSLGRARLAGVDALLGQLARSGSVKSWESFPAFGAVVVTGDASAVKALTCLSEVVDARPNRTWRLQPVDRLADPPFVAGQLDLTSADLAWQSYGAMGEGATLATIDTGAEWRHPLLRDSYRGRDGRHDYNWADFVSTPPQQQPYDGNGHGTAVLGLAVGRDPERAVGVAPAVEWIAVRAFDDRGTSDDLRLLRSAAWILAPTDTAGGNPRPDLAPDVVNGSWVLDNGADPLYADVAAAWEAAGIVAVFAAGNVETVQEAPAGILAPATYPTVLGIAALDQSGAVWPRSAEGPGFYGGVKPDLVAPGVDVVTADLGGGLAFQTGTSMAAPQAAGAAALLLSLDPELAPADVRNLLASTARDVGQPGPDTQSGWGLLNVRAAAEAASGAGSLRGLVVGDGFAPLVGAVVSAQPTGTDGASYPWQVQTAEDGRYRIALPAGDWEVAARAFGYQAVTRTLTVSSGTAELFDAHLAPDAFGVVAGVVRSRLGAGLEGATVAVVDSLPPRSVTCWSGGAFSLTVPAGSLQLRFSSGGARSEVRQVTVAPAETVPVSVDLEDAPSVLLVDADASSGERIYPYIDRALGDSGYLHDTWIVSDTASIPTGTDLWPYDVVLWADNYGSPGRAGPPGHEDLVIDLLRGYAAGGGRLAVSGQGVGADGASWVRPSLAAFYRQVLGAVLVAPATAERRLAGVGDFAGLSLELEWPTAEAKGTRLAPAVIAPAPQSDAAPILEYADGTVAAVAATGPAGRRAYLAFGPEGAGDREEVARLYERLLGWLQAPSVRLLASPTVLAPGQEAALRLETYAYRVDRSASVSISAPAALTLEAGPGQTAVGPDVVTWSGMLAGEQTSVLQLGARLTGAAAGAEPLTVTARVELDGRPVTATAELGALTPDLLPRLAYEPDRVPAGGSATLQAVVPNLGKAAAPDAEMVLDLPPAMVPAAQSLRLSAGSAEWLTASRLRWRAAVGAEAAVTLSLDGRLPDRTEAVSSTLQVDDGAGRRSQAHALCLAAGPDIRRSEASVSAHSVSAGEPVTLSVTVRNDGAAPAQVELTGRLPVGVAVEGQAPSDGFTRTVGVPAGEERQLVVRLRALAGAGPGIRIMALVLDDGARPSRPEEREVALDVGPPALASSVALLLPPTARSGDWVTGTLLVANLSSAVQEVHVTDTLAPSLALDPKHVTVSSGTLAVAPGTLDWRLDAAPPGPGSWASGAFVAPGRGQMLPRAAADGLYGPVDLPFAFPFVTAVYTRVWVTGDGLLRLAGPGAAGVSGELDPATVAPLWRPGQQAGWPQVRLDPDGLSLVWPGPEPSASFAALLRPSGEVRFAYAAGVPDQPAVVGLRAPDGRWWLLAAGRPLPGHSVLFTPPGGWDRLDFRAQVAAGLEPNSRTQHVAQIESAWSVRRLVATQAANVLDLSSSALTSRPSSALAGSQVTYELSLVARGEVDARGVEARIELPLAARLVPGSAQGGLTQGATSRELVWRGRVPVGAPVDASFAVRLPAGLLPGARLLTSAVVRAPGAGDLTLDSPVRVTASDFAGSAKTASRSVAWPGDQVDFRLRARNNGPAAVAVHLTDSLPPGLDYVPGSAWSSYGPAPDYRADARTVTWSADLPASSSADLGLEALYVGPGRQSNVMILADGSGTTLSAWADVWPASARAYLPSARRGP